MATNLGLEDRDPYLVLRWEIENSIRKFLRFIGEDPHREGLKDTPDRIIRSWDEIFAGYKQSPKDILKTVFVDGGCDEMVILKNISFYSSCEHHAMPFFGKCHIGYLPNGRVIGISKLARLVACFSKRLQIQERMTSQIADSLMKYLKPRGCMVIVEASHLCILMRGAKSQNSVMTTQAIRGIFKKRTVRSEFISAIGVCK